MKRLAARLSTGQIVPTQAMQALSMNLWGKLSGPASRTLGCIPSQQFRTTRGVRAKKARSSLAAPDRMGVGEPARNRHPVLHQHVPAADRHLAEVERKIEVGGDLQGEQAE